MRYAWNNVEVLRTMSRYLPSLRLYIYLHTVVTLFQSILILIKQMEKRTNIMIVDCRFVLLEIQHETYFFVVCTY